MFAWRTGHVRLAWVLVALCCGPFSQALLPAIAADNRGLYCQFTLGFAELEMALGHDLVGNCLEEPRFDPRSGDALQATAGGLLVWRKADNATAFTDGETTWVLGPDGVEARPNEARFAWEAQGEAAAVEPASTGATLPATAQPGAATDRAAAEPDPSAAVTQAYPASAAAVTARASNPAATYPASATPTPVDIAAGQPVGAAAPLASRPQRPPANGVGPAASPAAPAASRTQPAAPAAARPQPAPPQAGLPRAGAAGGAGTSAGAPGADEIYPLADVAITSNRGGRTIQTRPIRTVLAPDGREAVADRIVVCFGSNVAPADIEAVHALARANGIKAARSVRTIGPATQLVDVTGAGSLQQALALYGSQPHVRYALPDYIYHFDEVPNDPLFGSQWGMTQIKATTAWNVTHGSSARFVAVVDSGIYDELSTYPPPDGGSGHPDLRGKVVANVNFSSDADTDDFNGHGTHVAGIAAANTNNAVGVAGVGYLTRLLNVKVLDSTGSGPSSAIQAGIRWAADNGAHVINLSLGAELACTAGDQDAVDYAWAHNAVIVASAGNDARSALHTPASCNHTVAVASTDSNDTKSSFSSFGTWVHVAAPGGSNAGGTGILSTSYTGDYVEEMGTSMSAPHVSGLAALVWATSFGTSNQAVVDRILATADPVAGTGSFWRYGRVNAFAAVSPPACSPRPRVGVSVAPAGANRLQVTISVGGFNVFLQSIQFANPATNPSTPSNALIDIGSLIGQSGSFTYNAGLGSVGTTFFVRRAAPGVATTVPLIVTDSCGPWPTLVGGGPAAF